MDAQEKRQLLDALENGREALLDAVVGLSEDAAAQAPGPGRWSVRECVEHVVLAEQYMFGQIVASRPSETPVGSPERETGIRRGGADRARPLEAPAAARPNGRFPTLAEALHAFIASHDQAIRYVHALEEDPRSNAAHHPLIGAVNCYEMLLIIAVHPRRHAAQIHEIRRTFS